MNETERVKLRRLIKQKGLESVAAEIGVNTTTLLRILSDDIVGTSPGSQSLARSYLDRIKVRV